MRFLATITGLTLFLTLNANQGGEKIIWYSFEEAIELAGKNPRKLLVDIYTDWCGFCKRMDAETFSDPQVARFINRHFYPVKFNSETKDTIYFQGHEFINDGEGRRSAHQLSIAMLQGQMSYPSIVYFNEDLEMITAVPGFRTPGQIEPILRYIGENHYKNTSWENFQRDFNGTFE